MGGSMGMQVGEGIVKAAEEAKKINVLCLLLHPQVEQECKKESLALMQMPRTIAAIESFKRVKPSLYCFIYKPYHRRCFSIIYYGWRYYYWQNQGLL